MCDGNPIPTFCGEPERVKIPNNIDEFTNEIWNNLNEQNKISLYVRYIDLENGKIENRLINKVFILVIVLFKRIVPLSFELPFELQERLFLRPAFSSMYFEAIEPDRHWLKLSS